MGTQKPVKKFELENLDKLPEVLPEDLGGPVAEHHGKVKEKAKIKKRDIEEKIKEKKFAFRHAKPEEKTSVEKQEEKSADLPTEVSAKAGAKVKVGKAKIRSKRYQKAISQIDRTKKYDLAEAIELVKKTSLSKFDGNIEAHLRLLGKSGKPEQIRGLLQYPHPTGKKKELEDRKTEYKTDSYGIIHQVIGKVSAENKVLEENLRVLLAALPQDKIISITLAATMGPGVKVIVK